MIASNKAVMYKEVSVCYQSLALTPGSPSLADCLHGDIKAPLLFRSLQLCSLLSCSGVSAAFGSNGIV